MHDITHPISVSERDCSIDNRLIDLYTGYYRDFLFDDFIVFCCVRLCNSVVYGHTKKIAKFESLEYKATKISFKLSSYYCDLIDSCCVLCDCDLDSFVNHAIWRFVGGNCALD